MLFLTWCIICSTREADISCSLHTNENMVVAVEGVMTFGYYIPASTQFALHWHPDQSSHGKIRNQHKVKAETWRLRALRQRQIHFWFLAFDQLKCCALKCYTCISDQKRGKERKTPSFFLFLCLFSVCSLSPPAASSCL